MLDKIPEHHRAWLVGTIAVCAVPIVITVCVTTFALARILILQIRG